MLKRIAVLMVTIIMAFTLSSCNEVVHDGQARDNSVDDRLEVLMDQLGKFTLRVRPTEIHALLNMEPAMARKLEKYFVQDFKKEGYTLVISTYTDDDSFTNAALPDNENPPDVFSYKGSLGQSYFLGPNAGYDIQFYFDSDIDYYKRHLFQGAVLFGSSKEKETPGQYELVGIVPSVNTYVLAYNPALIGAANLDVDRTPKTLEDLLSYNKFLTKKDSNGQVVSIGMNADQLVPERLYAYFSGKSALLPQGFRGVFYSEKDDLDSFISTWNYIMDTQATYGGSSALSSNAAWDIAEGNVAYQMVSSPVKNAKSAIKYTTVPTTATTTQEYASIWCDDDSRIFSVSNVTKNDGGGWLFLKWYMTQGVLYEELEKYNMNPTTYIPPYLTYEPTRKVLYNMLWNSLDENTKVFIETRDKMMEKKLVPDYKPTAVTDISRNGQTVPFTYNSTITNDVWRSIRSGQVTVDDGVKEAKSVLESAFMGYTRILEQKGFDFASASMWATQYKVEEEIPQ